MDGKGRGEVRCWKGWGQKGWPKQDAAVAAAAIAAAAVQGAFIEGTTGQLGQLGQQRVWSGAGQKLPDMLFAL